MIRLLIVTTLMLLAAAKPTTFDGTDSLWQTFKSQHKRTYQGELEAVRKQIFLQNLEKIESHNARADMGLHSYWLGVNQFTDLTNAEFRKYFNGLNMKAKKNSTAATFLAPENIGNLPDHVDWRSKGYVTEVKNQEQCGSCWAFSATGSMEGQHFRKTGKLVSLSEQNLVDCSGPEGNEGCDGGFMDQAFLYVEKNKGIDTEESYRYKGVDGDCHFKKSSIGATFTSHADVVPHGNEDALKTAVATQGPISIAIDASHDSFQSYSHGVYDEPDCSSESLDHGVLAVGYGTQGDDKDYWIVKNSWAASWGMKGYILMSRNKQNQCGVATLASYPIV